MSSAIKDCLPPVRNTRFDDLIEDAPEDADRGGQGAGGV